MTKFEYCTFIQERETRKNIIMFSDENIQISYGETMLSIINGLGKEEWELVTSDLNEKIAVYWLKRELNIN